MRFSGLGKAKLTVVLAVAIFFVLSSLWLVLNAKTDDSRIHSAGIGFFFAAVIPGAAVARRRLSQVEPEETRLLAPQATVILKRPRLNSFYSAFKVGPIAWSDIRGAELRPYMKQEVLSLEFLDNEKCFARGYSMRKLNEAITKRFGLSPFIVSGEAVGHTSCKVHDAVAVRLASFGWGR